MEIQPSDNEFIDCTTKYRVKTNHAIIKEGTTSMHPRERVLTSLNHREPDRVPFMYRDVPQVRSRLLSDLQLETDEDLFKLLGIDFRWVEPTYIGPALSSPTSPDRKKNIFGVEYLLRTGSGGSYWEPETFPMQYIEDPALLDAYPFPDNSLFDFSCIEEQLDRYRGYAIMTAPNVYCSPGILSVIQDLFGMEKTFMDMYLNAELWQALAEKIMVFNRAFLHAFFSAGKGAIDFFRIGDDYGGQQGLLFGPEQYREFLKQRNSEMASIAKGYGAHFYQHSCGSIRALIPDMIESGVEVLDPIQVLAAGMEPAGLKRDFGGVLCFSGGVDEQDLLPNGTPEEVREGVYHLLDAMAPGGGFFLGPTHNFQEDIPTDNILALYKAGEEYFR